MNEHELLELYRKTRMVDGLSGRAWDALEYSRLNTAIEEGEVLLRHQPSATSDGESVAVLEGVEYEIEFGEHDNICTLRRA